MIVEQIYTGCLSQGAYYIESAGEAVIIDPLREVAPYIEKAKENKATIKYIFETHFHADFVSGHLSLSNKTGAPIVYGPNADPSFEAFIAKDLEEFKVGKLTFVALHTPGHTLESTTYLLKDEDGKDYAIFTGDTLFLGDVGRPDLAQKKGKLTEKDLAGMLYESLHQKIMPLEDHILVYPAHGAGSACGKKMMKETQDTLGNQKKINYALNTALSKDAFIAEVTEGLLPPPSYFPLNAKMNKEGYEDFDAVLIRGNKALAPNEFEALANQTYAVVLDVRNPQEFAKAHVPGAIFVGLDGSFAPWVGTLIADTLQPIVLVCDEGREEEAITRLSRVGFDQTLGYLSGGVAAWKKAGKPTDSVQSIAAETLKNNMGTQELTIVDVRKEAEYETGHIPQAENIPLAAINTHFQKFVAKDQIHLHCAGGYRSMIAASILKSRGVHNLIDIKGGYAAIKNANIACTTGACSTKTD